MDGCKSLLLCLKLMFLYVHVCFNSVFILFVSEPFPTFFLYFNRNEKKPKEHCLEVIARDISLEL